MRNILSLFGEPCSEACSPSPLMHMQINGLHRTVKQYECPQAKIQKDFLHIDFDILLARNLSTNLTAPVQPKERDSLAFRLQLVSSR